MFHAPRPSSDEPYLLELEKRDLTKGSLSSLWLVMAYKAVVYRMLYAPSLDPTGPYIAREMQKTPNSTRQPNQNPSRRLHGLSMIPVSTL